MNVFWVFAIVLIVVLSLLCTEGYCISIIQNIDTEMKSNLIFNSPDHLAKPNVSFFVFK